MAFTNMDREKLTEMHTLVTQKLMPANEDHEDRIRNVEGHTIKILTGATILSAIMGYATDWLKG